MAGQYFGVGGVARKVKNQYIGVASVARKIKYGFIGVGGVARKFFAGLYDFVFAHGGAGAVSSSYTGWYNGNQVRLYFNSTDTKTHWADLRVYGGSSFAGKTITITYSSSSRNTCAEIQCFDTGDHAFGSGNSSLDHRNLIYGSISGSQTVSYTLPTTATAKMFLISLSKYDYESYTGEREIIITSLKINGTEILI